MPGLAAGGHSADVQVRIGSAKQLSMEPPKETHHEITADTARLSWKDVGTFVIHKTEVLVYPLPNVGVEVLQLLLMGPVLAALLEQRGYLVLHASGAMFDDGAVAFLGASGWGKSTLAAALHARGHAIVADDFVALTVGDPGVVVQPGYAQLRLLPQDATRFGYSLDSAPAPSAEKTRYPAVNGFPTMPQQLRRIYVLGEGTCQQIEEIDPQNALIELIRHTYTARLLDSRRSASNFSQCAGVAAKVPIRRLRAGRELSALPEVAALVERDVCCA
ncbi:MAG: hypothetical protein WD802_02855 [Gemmatimonadaceae bacterium]